MTRWWRCYQSECDDWARRVGFVVPPDVERRIAWESIPRFDSIRDALASGAPLSIVQRRRKP